jgi:hypothetical protein
MPTQFFNGAGAVVDPWLDVAVAILLKVGMVATVEFAAGSAGDAVRIAAAAAAAADAGTGTDTDVAVIGTVNPDGVAVATAAVGAGIVAAVFKGGGGTGPFRNLDVGAINVLTGCAT